MTELTNEELARLLKQFALGRTSDRHAGQAQRTFFEGVRRPLERTVSHELIMHPYLAKLAAQEAWSEIFLSASRYDASAGTVVSWVKGIARNCAKRTLKQEALAKRLIVSDGFGSNLGDSSDWHDEAPSPLDRAACPLPGPDRAAQSAEIRQAVSRCLDRLPADGRVPYRQVYELALDSELSNKELVEVFNAQFPQRPACNEEQLRKWVARAGEKMRDCLGALLQLPTPAER
mgnify:CR=1 FL=1